MNKVFAGVSCLLFTSLDPRFESRFHAKDNIYDTASSGYNTFEFYLGISTATKLR